MRLTIPAAILAALTAWALAVSLYLFLRAARQNRGLQ